jgi:hypothetical protein
LKTFSHLTAARYPRNQTKRQLAKRNLIGEPQIEILAAHAMVGRVVIHAATDPGER